MTLTCYVPRTASLQLLDLAVRARSLRGLCEPGLSAPGDHRIRAGDTDRAMASCWRTRPPVAAAIRAAASSRAANAEVAPALTPDQVKKLLIATALPISNGDPYAAGAGQIDVVTRNLAR